MGDWDDLLPGTDEKHESEEGREQKALTDDVPLCGLEVAVGRQFGRRLQYEELGSVMLGKGTSALTASVRDTSAEHV
ncbi:MAG TPA: hypothetical protein VL984_10120, partial [Acidimicrobiales bacterium]|nr:hypothetical protein [Acidimicrobiales bacterium]